MGSQQLGITSGMPDLSWQYVGATALGTDSLGLDDTAYKGLCQSAQGESGLGPSKYVNYTDADSALSDAAKICSQAAASSNDDQRRRILDGAEAGRRGGTEAESAALKRVVFSVVASSVAVLGGLYAIRSTGKAAMDGKKEIDANTLRKTQMKAERELGLEAEEMTRKANQAQAKSQELTQAVGGPASGNDAARQARLDADNQRAAALHKAKADGYMKKADAAKQDRAEAAYQREQASMDSQIANSGRTRHLEKARNHSTLASSLSGLASAGTALAGWNDAARIRADADKSQADAYGGLSSANKQASLSQQSEMVNAKKALNNAEYQRLLAVMR
ncbi:hypothetical protein [Achromobacter aloeverae]|uniref:Uncharacterized protein n=1 Tax=Achromobacter aloeverae TaxID=1750518 RepID=A0A4Q1HHX2_9BURK|nr:hypothetical protein [Achromobacter aloeverae]RXN87778.1 hypothetical protein C7R54_14355 [Achromobacter aloeverae]